MSEPLCSACKEEHLSVKAVRIVPGFGDGLCQKHFEMWFRKEFCKPCEQSGRKRFATHKMNGMLMCREHAGAAAIIDKPPQALEPQDVEVRSTKKEKRMARTSPEIDWAQVQQERNAGASVEQLRKKYKTSWPRVAAHTTAPPTSAMGARRTGRRFADGAIREVQQSFQQHRTGKVTKHTGGQYDAVIADLTAKRDKLNEAIGVLHELNA